MLTQSLGFPAIAVLTLALGVGANTPTSMAQAIVSASDNNKTAKTQKELPPWERRPEDLRAAVETNKLALKLITAVFDAAVRRFEAESRFTPKVAPPDKNDPLSGPNDLAGSPLLQEFSQGAIWLSVVMSANKSDLSPQLQESQRELLEGLQRHQTVTPGEVKKEIRKPIRSKDVEKADTTREIQRVLQVERNYQEVVSQLRSAFPEYAELYLHQSPRLLNKPGEPTVFELCDPTVSADPLVKNERMQASLMVKIYRYDEHSLKIVSFWLYRNIEDPEMFVPRLLRSEKDKDLTSNNLGHWDWAHMPPRTFSSVAYASPAVTVLDLKFVNGEPVMTGRSTPAGRRRAQQVNLAGLDLNQLEPAGNGVLDASAPSFPVGVPDLPIQATLSLKNPQLGRDYMPRIREPYEFLTRAEYEAYMTGIREGSFALQTQPSETAQAYPPEKAERSIIASVSGGQPTSLPPSVPAIAPSSPVNTEQLNAVFLNPKQDGGLNELSVRARDSLKQFLDLKPVSTHTLVNQLYGKSNAGFRDHDPAAELLQRKLPKVREVNVYFFASDNTTASWRGPDDASGKGGIIVVLPARYYSDPQQFYKNVAGSLINQPLTSEDVTTLSNYLGGAAAHQLATIKQFPIEIDYLDHGWDENGDMRKWTDEAVDFFRHLQEAIAYLKPRLETIDPGERAILEKEIPSVEDWLNSLGDATVTVNFGLYKGKDDAPPPKVDSVTRTIWISSKAEEYVKSEKREYRWSLLAKLIEGFNGLKGGGFAPGITGAIYDVLQNFGKDKDNKLMIAWRLNADLPAKPAEWPGLAGVPRATITTSALAPRSPVVAAAQTAPAAATPRASKLEVLLGAVRTMNDYLNRYFSTETLIETSQQKEVVKQWFDHDVVVHPNWDKKLTYSPYFTDADTQKSAPPLNGTLAASVFMTLPGNTLSDAQRAIWEQLNAGTRDFSQETDRVALLKIPKPGPLAPNETPDLLRVINAINYYSAAMRWGRLDSDVQLQNLAWALNRQAPRRITATLFVSLDTGKIVTQLDENNRKLRQIPMTAVLAVYEKGEIILVERSVALNFEGDGFPDSLPGSAVVGILPPHYRVVTCTEGNLAIVLHRRAGGASTVADDATVDWKTPQQAELELIKVVGDAAGSGGMIPVSTKAAAEVESEQKKTIELAQNLGTKSPFAAAQTVPKEPTLAERPPQAEQSVRSTGIQKADPEFAKQVSGLIESQTKGVDDASLRAKILQTMVDRLIIVRDSNPNFHSKISSIDLREPNPKHFDFTVNKTEYFDALFTLAGKDRRASEVIWSTFEANLTTVEYAAGNHDFGPLNVTLQSDLTAIVRRHTKSDDSVVSQDIFDDPQFKALLPYYTSFWSNWQFAGESARFEYLHDHVTSKGLRQLANEAGKSPDTKVLKSDLVRSADEVDLFYGESVQGGSAIPAVESNAGLRANSLDATSIRGEPLRESEQGKEDRPVNKVDYNLTQVISLLQKVEQPTVQRSQQKDVYRRAFVIYQLLEAWNRMEPDRKEKMLAGEWKGSDLRFILPILAEIRAKKLSTPLDSSAIVKLSEDMPWIVDPKFDLTKGAFGKLPDTLRLQSSTSGAPGSTR